MHTENVWDGAGSTWVTAFCPLFDSTSHEVPEEGCSCGFYSLKELEALLFHAEMRHVLSTHPDFHGRWTDPVVIGRVLLSGKVIEHDLGYRAERARIAELIPFRGTERSIMVLANRLGVAMAPAVEPCPGDESDPRPLLRPVGLPPAHALAPREVPTPPPADPLTGPVAGVLAIVALIVSSLLMLAGVWQPPVTVVFLFLHQVGRSTDALSKMWRDLRGRLSRDPSRPGSLRLVPPPAT
jgi:hypothetical protein